MSNADQTLANTLDGVRGLAAISVVFSHVFLLYYSELHYGPANGDASALAVGVFHSPFTFFYRGGAAVLLFFLLSGYVLTAACIRKAPHDPRYVRTAATKRYLRLGLPVAAAVCLGYIGIIMSVFPDAPEGVSAFLDFPDANLGFLHMLRSAAYGSMLLGDASFDYVLWTISIEFYGSLLIFALYAIAGGKPLTSITLCLTTGVCLLFLSKPFHYYGLFFIGAGLAHLQARAATNNTRPRPGRLALPLLLAGCYLIGFHSDSASYQWLQPLTDRLLVLAPHAMPGVIYPSIGAIMIIAVLLTGFAAPHHAHPGRGSRLLAWIGKLSFSVYLLHPFLLASAGKYIFLELGTNAVSMMVCLVAVLAGTGLLSYGFYRHVDKPATQLANQFGKTLFGTA